MPNRQSPTAARPPAPGTHTTVHLLVGDGRMPVISTEVAHVVDREVLYLRAQVDDMPRSGTRHTVDVTISGPRADVAALLAQLVTGVERTGQ
jgi:hypothetical protein